jgi:antitoxin ParD1/3/4
MAAAEKISITITPQMAAMVNEQVAKGRYASASELIRDALRLWERDEEEYQESIASIRARLEKSLADPRPSVPLEVVKKEMAEYMASFRLKA